MPKILHDCHKNPPAPPPTYIMYDPLGLKSIKQLRLSPLGNYFLPYNSRLYVSLSRYLDVCVFGESTNFKISDIIIDITVH